MFRPDLSWRRRITPIRQAESHECILACIAMIAGFYGRRLTLSQLRTQFPSLGRGGTLRDMMEIARRLELSPRAVRADLSALEGLRLPCVVHWDFNHFVVLEKVNRQKVQIVDPAIGRQTIDLAVFSQHYTGVALELVPSPQFNDAAQDADSRKPSASFIPVKAFAKPIVQFVAISILALAFSLVSPLAVQIIVDEVILKDDRDLLMLVCLAFVFANVTGAIAAYAQSLHLLRYSALTRSQITYRFLERLLSHRWSYFSRRNLGSFVAQYNSLHFLVSFVVKSVGALISDTLFISVVSIILFLIEPKIALIVFVINLAVVGMRIALLNQARRLQDNDVLERSKEEAFFVESIRGISSVKANKLEFLRLEGNLDRTIKSTNASFGLGLFTTRYALFLSVVKAFEIIVVLYFLALAVMQNMMSVGMMYAFYAYRQFLDQRLSNFVESVGDVLNLQVHKDRLQEAFQVEEGTEESVDIGFFMRFKGAVAVEGIKYAVDNRRLPVLENFSGSAKAGEFVHVAGPTGAGKTTLLKIILNIIRPDNGVILVDQIPISEGNVSVLRNSVGVVLQEDTLFKGSIVENISLFDDRLDLGRVEECCKLCHIHDEIARLPLGYQSEVGDLGSNLSTGQQQRLLLARSLYRDPPILIYDEATANLNSEIEESILARLKQLNKTVIFASHSDLVGSHADQVWHIK
ncbi:peptidase domain-containing ABC transporter [Mesorhizobium sp. NPDC059054]|uniref:peptidase domain-containing ABC transporter n=1 Tax=Mesorhizobium sp. NPDC059054 TaxID=3346711 RepID=UPI0036CF2A19